jgi:mono/diheme cytochrome c family protein
MIAAALAGCANEQNEDMVGWVDPTVRAIGTDAGQIADAGADQQDAAPLGTACQPIQSAQSIPQRLMARQGAPKITEQTVFVDDLFNLFRVHCGGCHVDGYQGNIHTDRVRFSVDVDQSWIDSINIEDPDYVMPTPEVGGKLPSQRATDDPVNELARLLQTWYDAGRPRDLFVVPVDSLGDESPYRLPEAMAGGLTNLGTCMPEPGLYATAVDQMRAMDDKFANMGAATQGTLLQRIGLPEKLEDTDLFTFDSELLAQNGVVSYAPAYPVYNDATISLRHVRVPEGQSIVFHQDTQRFEIPDDTRFYRTILHKVIDTDGQERYRKLETQLIVSRADALVNASFYPTSLYGTYAWNEDETAARLVTDALRNGEPTRDRVFVYVTDAPKAEEILATKPNNPVLMLQTAHAVRRYAIPGSLGCYRCHRGSPSHSFTLGFQPLQMRRRPLGEAGVFDPVGDDELGQLERFIRCGLITGIDSADQVAGMEAPQGERQYRNDNELTAQAYLFANCAHCHNPGGSATVGFPELKDVLDFQPSATGGIFQYPLEAMSPRVSRGPGAEVPIPYITPSLVDYPVQCSTLATAAFYRAKWNNVDTTGEASLQILAPWRSLLYRGVDTPFAYSDDFALFPRMPMFTAGYDARAANAIARWMISIPARRANPSVPEYTVACPSSWGDSWKVDDSPQPYLEVRPDEAGYEEARYQANSRGLMYEWGTTNLAALKAGLVDATKQLARPFHNPDDSDILDPEVVKNPVGHPVPLDVGTVIGNVNWPPDGVPDHAHWSVTDLTEVLGPWYPRRNDAADILVLQQFPPPGNTATAAQMQAVEKRVVAMLRERPLSEKMRLFASGEMPFGLWVEKPECQLSSYPKVSSYDGNRPVWMDRSGLTGPTERERRVYTLSPGEFVYGLICTNCHGQKADSTGRQAAMLADMTGGNARVTNLSTGLFQQKNRQRVFGEAPWNSAGTPDDWAARYHTWMALGGTRQTIPPSILAIVANTLILGQTRARGGAVPVDANMLSTAKNLCLTLLPTYRQVPSDITKVFAAGPGDKTDNVPLPLIATNGDVDLWLRLCALDNPHPVSLVTYTTNADGTGHWYIEQTVYPSDRYPTTAPVMDHRGRLATGITQDNLFPWCAKKMDPLRVASDPALPERAKAEFERVTGADDVPYCPDELLVESLTDEQKEDWTLRGAINAGFATYVYIDRLVRGLAQPTVAYDHCEELGN